MVQVSGGSRAAGVSSQLEEPLPGPCGEPPARMAQEWGEQRGAAPVSPRCSQQKGARYRDPLPPAERGALPADGVCGVRGVQWLGVGGRSPSPPRSPPLSLRPASQRALRIFLRDSHPRSSGPAPARAARPNRGAPPEPPWAGLRLRERPQASPSPGHEREEDGWSAEPARRPLPRPPQLSAAPCPAALRPVPKLFLTPSLH